MDNEDKYIQNFSALFLDDILIVHKKARLNIDKVDKQAIKYIKNLTNAIEYNPEDVYKNRAILYIEYTKQVFESVIFYLNYLKSQKAKVDKFSIEAKTIYSKVSDIEEKNETNPQEALSEAEDAFNGLANLVDSIQIQEDELRENGKLHFFRWTFLPIATLISGIFGVIATVYKEEVFPNTLWAIIIYLGIMVVTFKSLENFFFKKFEEEYTEKEEESKKE